MAKSTSPTSVMQIFLMNIAYFLVGTWKAIAKSEEIIIGLAGSWCAELHGWQWE